MYFQEESMKLTKMYEQCMFPPRRETVVLPGVLIDVGSTFRKEICKCVCILYFVVWCGIWSYLVVLGGISWYLWYLGVFCNILLSLVVFGSILLYFVVFGGLWSHLLVIGSILVVFGGKVYLVVL